MRTTAETSWQTPIDRAVYAYWHDQIQVIQACRDDLCSLTGEAGALPAVNPEHSHRLADRIHDLRVAARRAQSVGRSLGNFLPAGASQRIRQIFRPLRRAADPVRDLDVLLAWLNGLPSVHLVTAGLLERLRRNHQRALGKLLKRLNREDTWAGLAGLSAWLEKEAAERGESGLPVHRVGDAAGTVLLARAADMTRYQEFFTADRPTDDLNKALHRLRIAGKDFRYALELLAPALGERAAALRKHFCDFQDLLGDLHDRIRFAGLLEHFAGRSCLPDSVCAGLLRELAGQRQVLWQSFLDRWPAMNEGWFADEVLKILHDKKEV
jgi:CHAD domain-containing protein